MVLVAKKVSNIHERWELVEPLLVAHPFRDIGCFERAVIACRGAQAIEAMRVERMVDEASIAKALGALPDRIRTGLNEDAPLHKWLAEHAKRWLEADGDHWRLRIEAEAPGHEIIRWRGLTMSMPPSILVAAAVSSASRDAPCRVQILPDTLAPLGEVAHLHVHLGPMLPFEAIWERLWYTFLKRGSLDKGNYLARISDGDLPEVAKRGQPTNPRKAALQPAALRWRWMLELAFIARIWLSRSPSERRHEVPRALLHFSRGIVSPEARTSTLQRMSSSDEYFREDRRIGAAGGVDGALDMLANSARGVWQSWRSREWHRVRTLTLESSERARSSRRGVEGIHGRQRPHEDDDVLFTARALRTWRDNHDSDPLHARLLCQYLRVKVALYRTLVVDPWTSGLRHFLDVVRRDSPYSKVIDEDKLLEELRLCAGRAEAPLRIGALEVHIPPRSWLKRRGPVETGPGTGRSVEPDSTSAEQMWILSFPRAEGRKEETRHGARLWDRRVARVSATCRLIARRLHSRPLLLRQARAISLMDWERNGPLWLFEKPLRRLLDVSIDVAASHPALRLRPLRTAFHLGEDFDHLLTGLRAVIEAFEWGLVKRGDRIGHALALGLDVESWCAKHPQVMMRPLDRILDLGYAWDRFRDGKLGLDAGDIERMRAEAGRAIVASTLYPDEDRPPLDVARDLWRALTTKNDPSLHRAREVREKLSKHAGKKAFAHTLPVDSGREVGLLKVVHALVHRRVAATQVVIEVNPSSNLLVGGFRSIFDQPTFHDTSLPIVLSADDPLTFGTCLADEYAYAWAGMVVCAGRAPAEATAWLEQAAERSRRYRFSTPVERGDAARIAHKREDGAS